MSDRIEKMIEHQQMETSIEFESTSIKLGYSLAGHITGQMAHKLDEGKLDAKGIGEFTVTLARQIATAVHEDMKSAKDRILIDAKLLAEKSDEPN